MALIPVLIDFAAHTDARAEDIDQNFASIRTAFNDTAMLTDEARIVSVLHDFQAVGAALINGVPLIVADKINPLFASLPAIVFNDISDRSLALSALQALAALGPARNILRMNAAGTGFEWGSHLIEAGHMAHRTTNQTLTVGAALWSDVVFPSTTWGSTIINAGTGVATIPSNGLYRVQCSARPAVGSIPVRVLSIGGTHGANALAGAVMSADLDTPISFEEQFAAGDTFKVQGQDNGTGLIIEGTRYKAHFSVTKVANLT
jgi:hypothetical protein